MIGEASPDDVLVAWRSSERRFRRSYENLGRDAARDARAFMANCPRHRATPLIALPGLAARLGIADLRVKYEGARFGLRSFKALGGAFAVARHLTRRFPEIDLANAASGARIEGVETLTFACASDGNHGRSVAFGARHFGARCTVWLPSHVSMERQMHIAELGAAIVRVEGSYDDAVDAAAAAAAANGWVLIADTTDEERAPVATDDVMQGYTVIAAEAVAQWTAPAEACPFSHVFVQAGVGGLAAALAAWLADVYGGDMPQLAIVEPQASACLYQSALAGEPTMLAELPATNMAMLSCGAPSRPAWALLSELATAFIVISDAEAAAAVRRYDNPVGDDPRLEVGESGAAGLAGLIAVAASPDCWPRLKLDKSARVLLIATEASTDMTARACSLQVPQAPA